MKLNRLNIIMANIFLQPGENKARNKKRLEKRGVIATTLPNSIKKTTMSISKKLSVTSKQKMLNIL